MAVDLDALDAAVSSQLCKGGDCKLDCDDALARRIGHDLPADADSCHAKEQYRLLEKGLYRTSAGKVLSLRNEFKPVATSQKIDVPKIHPQQVVDKNSPYVIDLQSNIHSASVGRHPARSEQAHAIPESRHFITAAHAEPDQRRPAVVKSQAITSSKHTASDHR